jgi:hypothetical protein
MFGSMGVAFWYGTWLVLQGTISPGTVSPPSPLPTPLTPKRCLPSSGPS